MELFWVVQILAGMLVVSGGTALVVYSLIHLARTSFIKEYIIAFIIIGIATSIPELIVALSAQVMGFPEIAYANAIGTSIVGMTFVAGMIAVFKRKLSTKNFFSSHDFGHLTLSTILLIVLTIDGRLSRFDGIILLAAFFYFLWNLFHYSKSFKLKEKETVRHPLLHVIILFLALFGIYFAAEYAVYAVVELRNLTVLPMFLITVVLLSPLGVIPELIYEFALVHKNRSELALGDLFTNVVVNTTFITGILAVIRPFTVGISNLQYLSSLFLVVILIFFNYAARTKNDLNWKEGLILILAYFMYIVSIFFIQIGA